MKAKALLDTNIIIYSEDDKILDENIQDLFQLSRKYKIDCYFHKKSIVDISKDKKYRRKQIILSKIKKYPELPFYKKPDEEYFKICGKPKSQNDLIDDFILFSIKKGAADYLVTEDRGIFSKALKLNLEDRVFFVKEFCEFLRSNYELKFPTLPTLERIKVKKLSLSDPIFDSIRRDYPEFNKWFKKISTEDREAWVSFSGKKISSICIFDPNNSGYKEQMKICTFKVDDRHQGVKLGELLLQQAIRFAYFNKKEAAYVEIKKKEENDYLINWFASFGFQHDGERNVSLGIPDSVMVKRTLPVSENIVETSNILEIDIKHFPYFVKPPYVDAFLIPIKPTYAKILFPDLESQLKIPGLEGILPCGNAIKKCYVCKSNTKKIKKGDLLFFYESERNKAVISSGFVEDIIISKMAKDIQKFIGKRSVYSDKNIKRMQDGRDIIALKFRYCGGLIKTSGGLLKPISISIETLKRKKVLTVPPRSILNFTKNYNRFETLLV